MEERGDVAWWMHNSIVFYRLNVVYWALPTLKPNTQQEIFLVLTDNLLMGNKEYSNILEIEN